MKIESLTASSALDPAGSYSFPRTESVPAPPEDAEAGGQKSSDLDQAVQTLNNHLAERQLEARYSVDDATNFTVIKIVDSLSGEMLRQIPSVAAIRLARALSQSPTAPHLLDEKV